MGYLKPKTKNPWWVRLLLWLGDLGVKRRLPLTRILAHHPRSLLSIGMMEAMVTHHDHELSDRQIQLVRLQVSLLVTCPFCVDMNAQGFWRNHVNQEELEALQGIRDPETVKSFSPAEKAVIRYVAALCSTPVTVSEAQVTELRKYFSERSVVILATTAAQVNLWARLIQGLGLPPEGFTPNCKVKLETESLGRRIAVQIIRNPDASPKESSG